MKKKIFWRIFALSALSVLLVFLFALYAVNRNSQHVVEERRSRNRAVVLRTEAAG